MKKGCLFVAFTLALFYSFSSVLGDCNCNNEAVTGVPRVECEALVAFYYSAGGPDWFYYNKAGDPPYYNKWNNPTRIETWFGVTVENGHVIGIDIPKYSLTPVRGTIAPELGALEFLEGFSLENEFLSGPLPAEWGNLTRLRRFTLRGNQLTGSIPPEWGNLVNLEEFFLQYNAVDGTVPPELGNLASIRVLNLEGNQLTGNIPPELGYLDNLEELYLGENELNGSIPPELGNISSLKVLGLGENRLEGTIPPELGNLSNLTVLALGNNFLEGSIPSELGGLSKLAILNLEENQLEGEIPSELWSLDQLTELRLSNNDLRGSIPDEIVNLTGLVTVDLSYNHISGSIPPNIGELTELDTLNLECNKLEGEIPESLGANQGLSILGLAGNKFSGPLPDTIVNLQQLNPPFMGTHTSTSKVGYNALYTDNQEVQAYMDDKFLGWSSSQTLAAENLSVQVLGTSPWMGPVRNTNRVRFSWDPITFQGKDGGYEVCIRDSLAGPCQAWAGITPGKDSSSLVVSGLSPGTEYYFDLFSKTFAHEGNQNTVTSRGSGTISIRSGDTVVTAFPLWESREGLFTGLAFSNYGASDAGITLTAYDKAGQELEVPLNPSALNVAAGKQTAGLGAEIFGVTDTVERAAWIEAESDQLVGSFFTFGSPDLRMLDGAVTQSSPARKLFLTTPQASGVLPKYGEDEAISIALINPFDSWVRADLSLVRRGEVIGETERVIPAKGMLLETGMELFGEDNIPVECYMEVETTAGSGIIGFSRVDFPESGTTFGLNAWAPSSAETLYSAQLASGPGVGGTGMETHIRLINTSNETRQVTFKAIAEDGTLLAEPVVRRILNRRLIKEQAWTLFEFEGDSAVGSLVIEVDSGGVVGDVIFTPFEGIEYAAAMPLQARPVTEAVFNHIANSEDIYTGLAFFNPGEEAAEITVIAKRGDGTVAGTKVLTLGPGERISRTLADPDMLPGTASLLNGFISISSTGPIVCQQLYGGTDLQFLAAVPPTTGYTEMF